MRDYILWGGTGQARVLIELLRHRPLRLRAVVDRAIDRSPIPSATLLRDEAELDAWLQAYGAPAPAALVAIGGNNGAERRRLQNHLETRGCEILTAVHDAAYVAGDARIGRGSQILAGSIVAAQADLGEAVIVNTGTTVDHDCRIGSGCHLAPGVTLAGAIEIGRDAFIGAGATVLPRLHIGDGAVIGAGAVVTSDIPAGVTALGVPARIRAS